MPRKPVGKKWKTTNVLIIPFGGTYCEEIMS